VLVSSSWFLKVGFCVKSNKYKHNERIGHKATVIIVFYSFLYLLFSYYLCKMSHTIISDKYSNTPKINEISQAISNKANKISIKGLVGSSTSFVVQALFEKSENPFLLIFQDKEEAAYYLNDLEGLVGEKDVLFFPSSHRRPYQIEDIDNANVL